LSQQAGVIVRLSPGDVSLAVIGAKSPAGKASGKLREIISGYPCGVSGASERGGKTGVYSSGVENARVDGE